MEKRMRNALKTLACSLILLGCGGCNLTLGPQASVTTVIVEEGAPIECLENRKVKACLFDGADGDTQTFKQEIGGWVMMPPKHWKAVKEELIRLRRKCGEPETTK